MIQKDAELNLNGKKYKLTLGLKDKVFLNGFYSDLKLNTKDLPE